MKARAWLSTTLGEQLTFQRGFDITKKEQEDGQYPVISSSGPNSTHTKYMVEGPGVVIGRKGTLGTVFYVQSNFWPHDTTLWVKDFHGNLPKYAYFFLKTMGFEQYDCGASNPTLNRSHIHTLQIIYPPLPTQRKIAGVLSAYDELIENNTRRIAILEEMAQAIYREWFVNFRFPGHEEVKLINSPLGKIPEGWKMVKVDDVIFVNPKVTVPKDGDKPFVSMGAVPHNTMLIDVAAVELRTGNSGSKFQNGDTLFARITPCLENGKTAFVQFLESASDVAFGSTEFIVLRSKTVCPEFVYLLARSDPFRDNAIKSMSGATGRQRVQEKCFDKFCFAHPDGKTLSKFSAVMQPLFRQVFTLAKKNRNLRTTRDLLLPKLISGQLDVEELDIDTGEPLVEATA
jgi:type I restriction enzyme S subunit